MNTYRVYTVGKDDHYGDVTVIECADDDDALERAKQLVASRAVDVWLGNRFIARVNHTPHTKPRVGRSTASARTRARRFPRSPA
jgi:hypothetical protein